MVQYLREVAVQELIYYDLDNPQSPTDWDKGQREQPKWRKFVQSAPSL